MALAARAAVRGAGLNVRINAAGLTDRAAADDLVKKAEKIEIAAEEAENEILKIVNNHIK